MFATTFYILAYCLGMTLYRTCVTSEAFITSIISSGVNALKNRFPLPKITGTICNHNSSTSHASKHCSETLAPATPVSLSPATYFAFATADTKPSDINVNGVVPCGTDSGCLCVTTNTGTPLLGWLLPHPLTISYVPRPTIITPAFFCDASNTSRFVSDNLKKSFTWLT